MNEFLFQLTMYRDGTIRYEGKRPRDLGEVLRILAVAADEGKIHWGDGLVWGEPLE